MKTIITLLFTVILFNIKSQQIIESSQYMNNKYSFNTGLAGLNYDMQIGLGARKQWVGIEDSPFVQSLVFQKRINESIGLGSEIYNDTWGLSRRTGAKISINYILPLSEYTDLSFGLAAKINQFGFKRNEIKTEFPDDIAIYDGLKNQLFPDAGISIFLNSELFYGGISVTNLIETKKDLVNKLDSYNYLVRTFYVMAGGIFELNNTLKIEPSTIISYANNAPFQFQIDAKILSDNLFWAGVGYRYQDAIIINTGIYISSFSLGYSYDISTSNYNTNLGSGSHELFLSFVLFGDNKKGRSTNYRDR